MAISARAFDGREPSEAEEQSALFEWARMAAGKYPELRYMYHVPNGGRRDAKEAAMLKAEGVRAGVPDICLPAARGPYHGLYIELKRRWKGKLSYKQREWLSYLDTAGYLALCCHGWQEAAEEIRAYLDTKT